MKLETQELVHIVMDRKEARELMEYIDSTIATSGTPLDPLWQVLRNHFNERVGG